MTQKTFAKRSLHGRPATRISPYDFDRPASFKRIPSICLSKQINKRHPRNTKNLGRLRDAASANSSSQRLCTSWAASRSRTNTEPPTTSPVAPTFPRRRPQNHPPHRAVAPPPLDAPRAFPLLPCCSSPSAHTRIGCDHAHRAANRKRQSPHPTVGGPRWPPASAWDAPRPQRSREDAGRTPPHPIAGHQLQI